MAKVLLATLPYPPSLNRYYGHWRNRVVLKKEGREYRDEVKRRCVTDPVDSPLILTARIFRPRKSGDIDNIFKCLLDSMQGVLYKNDSQIVELHAYRGDDKDNPRVEVSIECLT